MTTITTNKPYPTIHMDYINSTFHLCMNDQMSHDDDSVFRTLNKVRRILKYQYLYFSPTEDNYSKKPLRETYFFLIKTANDIFKNYLFNSRELSP
jgi:hypothetical protein